LSARPASQRRALRGNLRLQSDVPPCAKPFRIQAPGVLPDRNDIRGGSRTNQDRCATSRVWDRAHGLTFLQRSAKAGRLQQVVAT
jgi:hypothetical protein